MKKYTARGALNSDGARIQELVDPGGVCYPGVSWDSVEPWWVVVLDEDRIIGCVQVIASKPIGHVEFLGLEESLTDSQKAYAIKVIERYAQVQLHLSGVFIARSSIPYTEKQWKKIVKKRWGTFQFGASVYDMRLQNGN